MALLNTQHPKTDKGQKPTRYYSSKQERAVAKLTGGAQVKNSGATPFQKGDVTADKVLIECKVHTQSKDSMSIKKDWLEKNAKEALFMGKPYSVLAFSFGPDEKNYYILDEYTFLNGAPCGKEIKEWVTTS